MDSVFNACINSAVFLYSIPLYESIAIYTYFQLSLFLYAVGHSYTEQSIFNDEVLPQISELWLEVATEIGVPIEHVTAIQKKCFEEVLDYWKYHSQALNLPYNRDSMVEVLLSAPVNKPELVQHIRDMSDGGNDSKTNNNCTCICNS